MMGAQGLLAALSVLACTYASASDIGFSSADTPLNKVLEMLDGMLEKGKAQKQTEETEFAAYDEWCKGTQASYQKSIKQGGEQIAQHEADIAKAKADAEELEQEAGELQAKSDAMEAEAANATAIRKKQKADYMATHADFSESIDAVERAISVLKSRLADVPQSLVQVRASSRVPAETKAAIEALLALKDGQAPKANAYEFQSTSVVEMLEKLRLKFQDECLALEKSELATKSNHEVLIQKLTADIKQAKNIYEKKTSVKAGRLEDAATSQGDLETTTTTKKEDEKSLDDTTAECNAKSAEFEKNQVVRAEELKAIEQASEILRSESVSGNADKHLPSFAQAGPAVAMAQLRSTRTTAPTDAQQRAVDLLQDRAKRLGSRYLSLAASRMAADPFAKVKKLVQDLIFKLQEEANAEADHHAFCTTELATNKQTRETNAAEADELTAGIEKGTADSQRLSTELTELSDAVAEVEKKRSEAMTLRSTEKSTNTETIADAKEAQVAVERATQVLKEFYGKHSASLLQDGAGAQLGQSMSMVVSAPYKGMQAESGGIVGFLEVVLSDFARLETETSSAEDAAQEAHEKFMAESDEDLAVKGAEIQHKTSSKQKTEAKIASLKKELELTQEELDAALDYHEKLKPDCVNTGLSYEERVEKREQEIQSLQEALTALSQENLA